jgi:hypothetical protein
MPWWQVTPSIYPYDKFKVPVVWMRPVLCSVCRWTWLKNTQIDEPDSCVTLRKNEEKGEDCTKWKSCWWERGMTLVDGSAFTMVILLFSGISVIFDICTVEKIHIWLKSAKNIDRYTRRPTSNYILLLQATLHRHKNAPFDWIGIKLLG